MITFGLPAFAGVALLFLSGMRASALASLPLAAIDLGTRSVRQWPSLGVRTKNGKAATTFLLEIDQLLAVAVEWDSLVRARLPQEAMWYTPTKSRFGRHELSADAPGANRNIALAKRIRKLWKAILMAVVSAFGILSRFIAS